MLKLTVIRHGETDWNVNSIIQGHQQTSLNQRGHQQAEAIASVINASDYDAIYCSDLIRARQTLEPVAVPAHIPLYYCEELREWNLGVLETLNHEQARQQHPQVFENYKNRVIDVKIPDGESIQDRYQRSHDFLQTLATLHQDAHLLVVTHGGILDDYYRRANSIALEKHKDWPIYNASINRFQLEKTELQMIEWANIDHLQDIGSMHRW